MLLPFNGKIDAAYGACARYFDIGDSIGHVRDTNRIWNLTLASGNLQSGFGGKVNM